jgi:spermidine/putrescine-binding protein
MAAVLLMLGLLGACSRREVAGALTDEPRGTAPGYDLEKILNVYSWGDYIAPDTVSNFEKETGIKVHYDVYDNKRNSRDQAAQRPLQLRRRGAHRCLFRPPARGRYVP